MVEGIIRGLDNFTSREVAFCPLGNKKGLIENFEENYVNFEIDALIHGEVKCIDYVDAGDICMTNYASAGSLSRIINEVKSAKKTAQNSKHKWLKSIKHMLNIISYVIYSKNEKLKIEIDGEKLLDNYTMAHIANGSMLGHTENDNLEDGRLEYILVKKCSLLKRIELVKKILTKKLAPIDNFIYIGNCKKFSISAEDGKNTIMSYDGRAIKRDSLKGNVKNKQVKLVIPQVKGI
jgi:diacylglycerol kinase family enzyme